MPPGLIIGFDAERAKRPFFPEHVGQALRRYLGLAGCRRQSPRATNVESGQTLLISGASGGVGSAAVQIAVERGITVIGTASIDNQGYLHDLGALPTSYGEGWQARVRHMGKADAAIDVAGAGVIAGRQIPWCRRRHVRGVGYGH